MKHPETFSDHELLEILLYSVIRRQDTNALAHRILLYFKDLKSVFEADVNDLKKIDGVGDKVAMHIKTVGLIMTRAEISAKSEFFKPRSNLHSVIGDVTAFFQGETEERFVCFFLDERYRMINYVECTSHDAYSVNIDIKLIVDALAISKPTYAIIAHNHPTGSVKPSNDDDVSTVKLYMTFSLHGVQLTDHLIVGHNKYFSYFKEGRMQHIKDTYKLDTLIKKSFDEHQKSLEYYRQFDD
ncbi:MAG: hypothetical protein MJ072_00175 [Clostridia bacterium]|nr:hypothetical protein [Clostridia bacterium]